MKRHTFWRLAIIGLPLFYALVIWLLIKFL